MPKIGEFAHALVLMVPEYSCRSSSEVLRITAYRFNHTLREHKVLASVGNACRSAASLSTGRRALFTSLPLGALCSSRFVAMAGDNSDQPEV